MTVAESESDFRIIIDTPYLALTGELWGVYCEDLGENWPRYNGTALYFTENRLHCDVFRAQKILFVTEIYLKYLD